MAILQNTFGNLYGDVMYFLGWITPTNSTPVLSANIDDAKKIVNDAYAKFINSASWSFLKPEWQLTTIIGKWEYLLPEGFIKFESKRLIYSQSDAYSPVDETGVENILNARASLGIDSCPEHYAVRADKYDPEFGQRFEIIFYPTPDASYTLNGQIAIMPVKLSNDNDLPIGGPEYSSVLKQMCLAEAERMHNETAKREQDEANKLLMMAIQRDIERNPRKLGKMTDPKYQGISEIIGLRDCDDISYKYNGTTVYTRNSGL